MILTNNPIEPEGTRKEPLPSQSHRVEELRPVIGQLQSQLRDLELERAAIVKRIGIIRKTVFGLADIFGPDVINRELQDILPLQSARRSRTPLGLTDLCRQLLREVSEPLTVRQILRQLQDKSLAGLDGQRHRDNSLRVILSRLVAYGDAEELRTTEGLCAWKTTVTAGKLADVSSPTPDDKHTSQ
jgi:hypothetical protein